MHRCDFLAWWKTCCVWKSSWRHGKHQSIWFIPWSPTSLTPIFPHFRVFKGCCLRYRVIQDWQPRPPGRKGYNRGFWGNWNRRASGRRREQGTSPSRAIDLSVYHFLHNLSTSLFSFLVSFDSRLSSRTHRRTAVFNSPSLRASIIYPLYLQKLDEEREREIDPPI